MIMILMIMIMIMMIMIMITIMITRIMIMLVIMIVIAIVCYEVLYINIETELYQGLRGRDCAVGSSSARPCGRLASVFEGTK